jgi:hypothetical protein
MIENELAIFARFARSLTHLLRGDVSVISNELVYLSSVIDKRELLVSQKRCAAIAEVLSTVSSLGTILHKSPTSIRALADTFGAAEDIASELVVECDAAALGRCGTALRRVLGSWSATVSVVASGRVELAFTANALAAPARYHDSLSSYVSEQGTDDVAVLMSAAVDMIIRGHGWRVSCSAHGERCKVLIEIPAEQCGIGTTMPGAVSNG